MPFYSEYPAKAKALILPDPALFTALIRDAVPFLDFSEADVSGLLRTIHGAVRLNSQKNSVLFSRETPRGIFSGKESYAKVGIILLKLHELKFIAGVYPDKNHSYHIYA